MMIGVKGSEPRLFITTVFGREAVAALEVESTLLDMCPDVVAEYSKRKGIVVVFSKVCDNPYAMLLRLRSRGASAIRWAIPLRGYIRAQYEDIKKACHEIVLLYPYPKPIKMVGVCRKRGWYIDSCSRLLRYVGEHLENLGIAEIDFRNYEHVLRIEIVEDTAFLAIYRRHEEKLLRFGSRDLYTQTP